MKLLISGQTVRKGVVFNTFFFEKANRMKEIRNLDGDPYLFIADPPLPEATWVQHKMVYLYETLFLALGNLV